MKQFKGKILVVDDSTAIITLITAILDGEDYEVVTAFSGEEAIEKTLSCKPDVILLDVMMPGIDGFQTCAAIKSYEELKDIPVIIVTAVNDTPSKVKGLKLGACDYLTKPFNALELLARVGSQMRIKNLQDELKARNNELVKTYNELKDTHAQIVQMAKLSALGEMIAGVAHELNNPLTGIIGYSELLIANQDTEKFHRQLSKVHKQAVRCKKIIQNLLSFSRGQSPEKIKCNLNDIIIEVLELIRYQLNSDNIKICKVFDDNLPNILVDRNQLQQVFLNIINNSHQAMKHMEREKIITIRTFFQSSIVTVEISDTGGGIPMEYVDKIFDPFFTTKDVGEGTGLGLSICYGIIKDHKGNIKVSSSINEGTTFKIEIPLSSEKVYNDDNRDINAKKSNLKKSVLVVDDEEVIREVVCTALENIGHNVDTSSDGSFALEKIKQKDYDLILTDIKMPGIDGKVFFEAIKEQKPELSDKILFMSGDTLGLPRDNFLLEYKERIIEKPFSILQLQTRVNLFFSAQ